MKFFWNHETYIESLYHTGYTYNYINDQDWYYITVDQSGTLQIDVSAVADIQIRSSIQFGSTGDPIYYGGDPNVTGTTANIIPIYIDGNQLGGYYIHIWDNVNNEFSEDPYTITATFTPTNNPPNVPNSPIPLDSAIDVSVDISLGWMGGDPDTGDTVTYDVYFGTSNTPPMVSDDQSAITYDPGTLISDTRYYWKIVASDNHGVTTEGPLWSFTTTVETGILGDFNGDDLVNSTDALIIMSYDVGISVPFQMGETGYPSGVTPCTGCSP